MSGLDATAARNQPYAPRGTNDVDAILRADDADESLQRYKAQLLGAAAKGDRGDASDPRKLVVTEFRVVFNSPAPDQVFHLDTRAGKDHLKKTGVAVKEGSEYKFRLSFRVQHEILPGLKYVNRLKRMGMKTAADELVIGSYAPQTEPHSSEFPRYDWLEAPKGMMYRGAYTASDKFVDGDGRTHLEYDYPVKVTK